MSHEQKKPLTFHYTALRLHSAKRKKMAVGSRYEFLFGRGCRCFSPNGSLWCPAKLGSLASIKTISSSWWFQPIWKILVKMGIFPNRDDNKKYLKPPPSYHQYHHHRRQQKNNFLTSVWDLFGMVTWPFQWLSDLQLGDIQVTLNHLVFRISIDNICSKNLYEIYEQPILLLCWPATPTESNSNKPLPA